MSATEKPVTELTPKTSTSALSGNAVVIYNKTTGDADSLDGDSLKTLLDDADTAYQLPQTGIPRTDLSQDIKDELDSKASRDTDAVEGDLAEFDANGNPVDSGIATSSVMLKDVSAGEGDLAVFNDEGGVTPGFNVDEVMRKTVGTVEGNLAEFNADGNPVDSGVPTSKIGEIDEKVTVLRNSAGIAEGIADTISAGTPQEFVFRQSGGDGVNYMKRIKGRSIVWNQLVSNLPLASGVYFGLTVTNNGDGSYTFNGTTTGLFDQRVASVNVLAGHKYFVRLDIPNTEANFAQDYFTLDSNGCAITIPAIDKTWLYLTIKSGVTFNNVRVTPQVTDLTLAGIAGEISTPADFETLYPAPYYPYSAGKLISNDASEIETVGRNVWDEEWEPGNISIDTGEKTNDNTRIRSKNLIPIFPSTIYYFKTPATAGIRFYDSSKNYLGRANAVSVNNETFTTPSGAYYLMFSLVNTTTYNHDICVNLSDSNFNGQYEPYRKSTLHLGLNNIRVKSHNIWDEEWESGTIDPNSGLPAGDSNHIRSKNLIHIVPGGTYYFRAPSACTFIIWCYTKEGTPIRRLAYGTAPGEKTYPADVEYIKFATYGTYGSTYQNDICINVSSSFNGQYEPHGVLTFNGVPSAGSVYDEIVGNKYVKREAQVDLGDLTWSADPTYSSGVYRMKCTALRGIIKNNTSAERVPNYIICSKYSVITPNNTFGFPSFVGNGITVETDGSLTLYDAAHNSQSSAPSPSDNWLAGVMLNYALATPIEYELVDHLPFAILVDKFGTEQAIYPTHEDGTPSAPFACDSNYSISVKNLVAIINSLNAE